jgi:peptide/nickel transport system substrate-binding protein
LGDIGLNIAVNTQPVQDHSRKVGNGQSDFWMESIPSGAAGSQQLFRYGFHSQGAWNDTGYANPHVDELIDQLDMTSVSYAREAVIEEIWHTIKEDIAYLPLHHEMVIWAMRRELELPVDPKNWPRFHLARFK